MRELTNDKIQELVELVGHGSVSVKHRNQKIREWIAINTRPNDAKKMIAEIELLTEALKISCRHQLIVEALSLPECDEMIEQYDDSDDQELMDSYIERAKQSIEGEEG